MHFKYVFLKMRKQAFKTGIAGNGFEFISNYKRALCPSFSMRTVGKGIEAKEHKTEQVSK